MYGSSHSGTRTSTTEMDRLGECQSRFNDRRPAARISSFLIFSYFLFSFSGTLVTLPPSMKEFNIFTSTDVQINVAAIEWPANATALVYDDAPYRGGYQGEGALVCRTTDPDESKEGAETSEIRITCKRGQVVGTSLHSDLRLGE